MAVTVQFTGDAAGAVAAADAFNAAMNTMATNLVATQQQVHNFTRDADSGLIEFRNSVEKSLDAVGNKFKTTRDALGETIRIRVEHVNPRLAEGNTLAQNFGQSLGGVPGNATQTGITNIEKANVALQKLYATSNVSQARMEQLFLAIQTGSVRGLGQLTLEEQKAEIALRNLVKAFNNASTAGTRTADVMINFRTALRIVAIQQLHLLVSKLTQALLGNQKAASDFEIQIGQIQTITQKANLTTTQWAASLTNLSNNFGTDLIQTAAAAYEAASNQISKGAGVTVFLADAFELARTTAATAEQAVNILSSAINAYGGAAFEASRLSAILFKVADLGRVKVGEMANTFGNTATLAKALGISITELGASISTLTIQGIRYDTSATLVNNIILKLIKPTEAMSELFAKWGVTSGQAAIATYGFGGVLHKLGEELASGGLNRIGELESDMRAIRSVIGQTGGNSFQVWTNAFNEMADAQEQFDAAAKITAETVAYKLNKEANALHNLFVSVASTEVNRLFLEFTENIGGLANSAKPFVDTLLNMIKVMSDFTSTMIQWSKLIPLTNSSLANLVPTAVATYGAFRVGGLALAALTTIQTTYNNLIQQGTWQLIAQGVAENNITRGMALQTGATTALTTALNSLTIARGALLFGLPLLAAAISSSIASYYETQRKITSLQGELEA
ncbi:MAG: phage tail tape measure protein, partial [Patescibacteria group bacterium]|nr:phage tail tape measure protein [Patescibacteria group bacterium]MDE2439178.1 phage tail tape measure protein [Patescibacteria group bacterium]